MQYRLLIEESQVSMEEQEKLMDQIHDAEDRGDIKTAEILRTQIPFDDKFVRALKPYIGEEACNKKLESVRNYWMSMNRKVLQKYSLI